LFVAGSLTFVLALDNAPPGVVVVLINTSPMWAVVLAMVLLKERLDRYALAGAALSVAGIFVTLAFR
jgi:drug/metabolite transporter (DMT)-like permease